MVRRDFISLIATMAVMNARAGASPRRVPIFNKRYPEGTPTARLLTWLGERLGIEWQFHDVPWTRAQLEVASGNGVMFGLRRTAQRESEFRFSELRLQTFAWAIHRIGLKGSGVGANRLAGLSACSTRGSAYRTALQALNINDVRHIECRDDETALRMSAAGRCDVALITVDSLSAEHSVGPQIEQLMRDLRLVFSEHPIVSHDVHFAVGHNSDWLWVLEAVDGMSAIAGPGLSLKERAALQQRSKRQPWPKRTVD